MKYLLDTDTCIYIIKNNPASVAAHFRKHAFEDVGISSISVAELEYGTQKSGSLRNQAALKHWLALLQKPAFDVAAASKYGTLRAHLEQIGKQIGPLDMLIAAHALSLDVTLVSNNVREFSRVPGLKLENWTTP
jgi:tRNA(fMet)-specific endonuclease VapC